MHAKQLSKGFVVGTQANPSVFIMSRGAALSVRGVAGQQDREGTAAAPEPLHMEQQQIDFPGRLDATQLEGCWINVCGCCQGFRRTYECQTLRSRVRRLDVHHRPILRADCGPPSMATTVEQTDEG